MPCRSHQGSDPPQAKGSCLADRAAKQAAAQDNIATKLMVTPVVSSLLTAQAAPVYDKEKKKTPPGHELSKVLARHFVMLCLIALCADASHCAKNNLSPKETAPSEIQIKGDCSI